MTSITEQAIKALGGYRAAADQMGVSLETIYHWKRTGKIPEHRLSRVCYLTKNQFTPTQLRPDLNWKKTITQQLVAYFGSQEATAQAIDATRSAVAHWVEGNKIPTRMFSAIETATNGEFTRQMLRPDIFGEQENANNNQA